MGSIHTSAEAQKLDSHEGRRDSGVVGAAPPSEHWRDEKLFVKVEAERREINSSESTDKLFLSHCWRLPSTQEKKRRIAAYLSTPSKDGGHGHVYWGDWLDLQSEGPVAWRSEIEQGIRDCSKFVAFIDEAYLTSYNCLQEVAMAFRHSKPVVVIVLTQAAWDLLTVPGGAQKAKKEGDKQVDIETGAAAAAAQGGPSGPRIAIVIPEGDSPPSSPSMRSVRNSLGRSLSRAVSGCMSRSASNASAYLALSDNGVEVEEDDEDEFHSVASPGVVEIESMESPLGPLPTVPLRAQSTMSWFGWTQKDQLALQPSIEMKAASAWSSTAHGAALENYEDEEIVSGKPMSLGLVRHLFYRLAAINMCPCRELDESVKGADGMLSMVGAYVEKDLKYHKDHAALRNLALRWSSGERASDKLLRGKEAESWNQWLTAARMSAMEPRPTKQQQEFVEASVQYSGHRRFMSRMLVVALIAVLVGGVVASTVLAMQATKQEGIAKTQALRAEAAAEESRLKTKEVLAVSSLRLTGQEEDFASLWELKVAYNVLSRLTDSRLPSVNSSAIAATRSLLGKPINVPVCTVFEGGPPVNALSLSPGGDLLATGNSDTIVRIYRVGPKMGGDECFGGKPVQELTVHTNDVMAIEWSPSGAHLATASFDNNVIIWSVDEKGRVATEASQVLTINYNPISLAWSPSGRLLVVGTDYGNIYIYPVEADGSVSDDSAVELVDAHFDRVGSVRFSPSGTHFASGSSECRVWSVTWVDGKLEVQMSQELVDSFDGADLFVESADWSPDGSLFAMASQDVLSIRQVQENGTVVPKATQIIVSDEIYDGSVPFYSLAWAPAGDMLASGDVNGLLRVFEVTGNGTINTEEPERILTGHSGAVGSLAWSPSGQQLFSSGKAQSGDTTARLWEPRSTDLEAALRGVEQVLTMKADFDDGIQVLSVDWSPAGNAVASGHYPGVRLWGLREDGTVDPSSVQELEGHPDDLEVFSVAFSPSGLHLATATYGADIRIWALHPNGTAVAGQEPQLIVTDGEADGEKWLKLAWSPSGDRLACGTNRDIIYVWPVLADGTIAVNDERRQKLSGHEDAVYSVSWAPSGKLLASGSTDNTVRLWRVADDGSIDPPEAVQVLEGHTDLVIEVAWAPSSDLLVSGSGDRTIRAWPVDEASGLADVEAAQVIYAHADYVSAVRFSPAGDVLASGSDDRTVKLWPVHEDGTIGKAPLQRLSSHTDWVLSLDWNPEGTKIASVGSFDHTVRVSTILSVEDLRQFLVETFPTTDFELTRQEILRNDVPGDLQELFPEHPLLL